MLIRSNAHRPYYSRPFVRFLSGISVSSGVACRAAYRVERRAFVTRPTAGARLNFWHVRNIHSAVTRLLLKKMKQSHKLIPWDQCHQSIRECHWDVEICRPGWWSCDHSTHAPSIRHNRYKKRNVRKKLLELQGLLLWFSSLVLLVLLACVCLCERPWTDPWSTYSPTQMNFTLRKQNSEQTASTAAVATARAHKTLPSHVRQIIHTVRVWI